MIVGDCQLGGHDIHIEISPTEGSRILRGRICLSYAANSSPAASLSRACVCWTSWQAAGVGADIASVGTCCYTINYFGESITDCALRKYIEVYVMHVCFCVFCMRLHWQYMQWLYPKEHVDVYTCVIICVIIVHMHKWILCSIVNWDAWKVRCETGHQWFRPNSRSALGTGSPQSHAKMDAISAVRGVSLWWQVQSFCGQIDNWYSCLTSTVGYYHLS